MLPLTPPVDASIASFRCADAQEQAAVLPGWNQMYWQLSGGAFAGTVDAVDLGGVYVFVESANRSLLQRGSLAAGSVAVAVPTRLEGAARFCGTVCSRDQLYVYSGRSGFEFCSPADHQVAAVALAPQTVAALGEQAGRLSLLERAGTEARVHSADPQALAGLRQLIGGVLQAVGATPALLDSRHARAGLADAVVASLCELFEPAADPAIAPLHRQARRLLVARARDRIESTPQEPITVAELCDAVHVSRRTLQACFQDVLGLSPLAYLRAMRLNGARRALAAGASVTDAALDWGFWHLGQFSADYRRMFGELPSKTVARARVAAH